MVDRRSFAAILDFPPIASFGIVVIVGIVQELVHIQDTRMIIESQIQAGYMNILRIFASDLIQEMLPGVQSLRTALFQ